MPLRHTPRPVPGLRRAALLGLTALHGLLAACSSPPQVVQGPTSAPPVQAMAQVERLHTGAIFQPNASTSWLFSDQSKPRRIGDTLKVDIAESLSASNRQTMETGRENKVASKGPGSGDTSLNGILTGLLNMDASASGSDSFKGNGKLENANQLKGKLAATVINVLPNGNLVVAGERRIGFNGNVSTLRFSGVVSPRDIQPGGIVASTDVVDARFEHLGQGDMADANTRGWLQRALTNALTVW
ncbi:flagellar L-ring protein precursor FlgH [Sphaerotilus hippei]|uniref:Flagellar L-ring protein n=1 Tax=Sphaerotilus hippei TaxID=744406 RepID=A0A318H073_9BURK|nr:flagellar basal body L-ring protein FlgH [Sphaerotilus hippei]PXW93693.1 flagellar L-ring protein precursor FlgH [Sphaerotilus hippei]